MRPRAGAAALMPGALIPGAVTDTCEAFHPHCITCGDEGVEMRVLSADEQTATCSDPEQARHEIAVELVGPVAPGDQLLVHAGVAIRHLGALG